ncbi:DUF7240 domain-containing protein [Nocardia cyriacigeorgica]|uniref:DUF7240 domain-containing protein n=1 Tax=Nocardia cyriacigeorgica TaxID=135487 RepID=UPI003D80A50A
MDVRRIDRREVLRRAPQGSGGAGHRPPYRAVVILAAVTLRNWRRIRARLALAGITQPLRQLELHALLDIVEAMMEEGMDSKQLTDMRADLYKPDPEAKVDPAGFTPRDEMASFRAMQARFAGFKR